MKKLNIKNMTNIHCTTAIVMIVLITSLQSCLKINPNPQPQIPFYSFVSDGNGGYILSQYACSTPPANLVIPATYNGAPVTAIGNMAFFSTPNIANVIIPSTVTSIGAGAFAKCIALKKVYFPAGLTSIGYGAFAYCRVLDSLNIPDGVTDIQRNTFDSCSALKVVRLSPNTKSIGNQAFNLCANLVFFDSTKLTNLTTLGTQVFYKCSNLQIIDLSKATNLQTIGNQAFRGCTGVTKIILPNTVQAIGNQAFDSCTALVTIGATANTIDISTLSNLQTINPQAFNNCTKITTILLPANLQTIGAAAFNGCTLLATMGATANTLDLSTLTALQTINSNAFSGCAFVSIKLPSSLTSIAASALSTNRKLTTITASGNYAVDATTGALLSADGKTFIAYPTGQATKALSPNVIIPSTITTISDSAFRNDTLSGLTIPASVTFIGANNWGGITFSSGGITSLSSAYPTSDSSCLLSPMGDTLLKYLKKQVVAYTYAIPASVKVIAIGSFAGTPTTAQITLNIPASVISIPTSLNNQIVAISVDANNKFYSSDTAGVLFNKEQTMMLLYPFGKTYANYIYNVPNTVTTINSAAFGSLTNAANTPTNLVGLKFYSVKPPAFTTTVNAASTLKTFYVPNANLYDYASLWTSNLGLIVGY